MAVVTGGTEQVDREPGEERSDGILCRYSVGRRTVSCLDDVTPVGQSSHYSHLETLVFVGSSDSSLPRGPL